MTAKAKTLARYKAEERRQSVQFTRLDNRVYNHAMDECEGVAEHIESSAAKQNDAKSLTASWVHSASFDLFNTLHKPTPKQAEEGGDALLRDLVARVQRAEDYPQLHAACRNDRVVSALQTGGMLEKVVDAIPQELKDAARKAARAQQEAREFQGLADALDNSPDGDSAEADEARANAKAAKQRARELAKALNEMVKGHGRAMGQAVHKAVHAAAEEAEAVQAAAMAFGQGSNDAQGGMSIAEKLALAKTVQQAGPAFKKLLQILGRAVAEACQKQAAKMRHEAGEIVDVVLGGSPAKLLPTELVLHSDEDFVDLACARLALHSAMNYDVEAREPQRKGDIIVLFDESGSMSGQKEAEAKAVTLALCHIAVKQKRAICVHFFQGDVTHTERIDPKDENMQSQGLSVALRKMAAIAGRGTGGGTDFDKPLMRAIKTSRESLPKADVFMVTDGISSIAQETIDAVNAERSSRGMHFYTMLFGMSDGHAFVGTVRQFADKVWAGESLLNGPMGELFEAV